MSMMNLRFASVPVILLGSLLLFESAAEAQRKNPLEGQPAVRHRLLLVKQRFEISPAFESSINADFKHNVGGGLKLEYHLSDMLSIGAVGFYSVGLDTNLNSRIVEDLPTMPTENDPTPTRAQWEEHLNTIPIHGAGYVTVTPWYGKLAAFGNFFVNFDFYFSGGVSFAQLKNECCSFMTDPFPGGDLDQGELPDNNPNNDPAINDGNRIGGYLGGGVHLFLSNAVALDLTIRSYLFSDNPSGLDFNADLAVTEDDNRFLNHLFMGLGISVFLPAQVKRTP
jgi:outer membrane beta-barrel protein